MSMIYIAYNYCGLTLRVIWQRYGGISDSAVKKVVSRLQTCLSKDKKLTAKKKVVSSGEMRDPRPILSSELLGTYAKWSLEPLAGGALFKPIPFRSEALI